jgi:dipeptidyl aminopeptidase/acylaminoacyl peptidase
MGAEIIDPEALAELPTVHHPAVGPNGRYVAFYYDETGRNELYLFDRECGEYEQISAGNVPKDATFWLRWDPTGERIYFHQDDAGDEQTDIYAMTLDGEAAPVVEVDGQAMLADISSDGTSLLFASDEGEQLNLYRHDRESNGTEQLTTYDRPVGMGVFSPDGDRIAYSTNESDDLENEDVYLMAADGSDKRRLDVGETGAETTVVDWFPGGERLLLEDDSDGHSRGGIYDIENESATWLDAGDGEETPMSVSPDGDRVFGARLRDAASLPVVYDVETGEGHVLDIPEGVLMPFGPAERFADASTVIFKYSTAGERPQLYEYDLERDDLSILVSAQYGEIDPETFVDATFVTYESEGATAEAPTYEIGGLLYDPRDSGARDEDDTDVPAIVRVHGGPHGMAFRRFNYRTQYLVSQGYAVFEPNFRGSLGRGRTFKNEIHGDWGGSEQSDIANGGRWLMDREWIDADRVGVFGGSFGGYSVYCQLTQYPTLWTTGIAWVGITDLHKLFEEDMAHFKHSLRVQMGDPEENHELWRERSPIEHVDAMERPIYMIHGVNDPRCPISQARLFRDALEERGWEQPEDFEYDELEDEGHGSTDIEQKTRVLKLLAAYLERRL